jgi:hypothetical protein
MKTKFGCGVVWDRAGTGSQTASQSARRAIARAMRFIGPPSLSVDPPT